MRSCFLFGFLLFGSIASASPITSQGSTSYLRTADGCTQQTGAGQVTAGATYASCVNQEWLPLATNGDDWLVNGALDGRSVWSHTVSLAEGDVFETAMSVVGLCCRSDYSLYRGNDSLVSLVFGWGNILWESGHIYAQQALTAQQFSTFIAPHAGDLTLYVYDLTNSFENNDFLLGVDGNKMPPVPEPATGLLSLGAACLYGARLARRRWNR